MHARTALALFLGLAQLLLTTPFLADHFIDTWPVVREIAEYYTTTESSPHCDNPEIEVVSSNWGLLYNSVYEDGLNNISVPYGQSLEVNCLGPNAARFTMMQDGTKLRARQGEDRIEWVIQKAGIIKAKYACTDTETNCVKLVFISVTPVMKVLAYKDLSSSNKHIIQYGNPLTVLCSGSAGARLTMTKDSEVLKTANVDVIADDVTIKWFERKPDLQISEYRCTDADTGTSSSVGIRVEPYFRHNATYRLEYGKSNEIEVFCSAPRPVKLFTVEGGTLHKELLTEKVNDTTVKSFIVNLKVGESLIACVDGEVPDYMSTISIKVTPRLEVLSSSKTNFVDDEYYIEYGYPSGIVCSGPNATQLTISEVHSGRRMKKLNYTVVNETAIKWDIKSNTFMNDHFACYEDETSAVIVTVRTYPLALNFRCVSENLQSLKCSWTSTLKYTIEIFDTIYTLTHMQNGNVVHVCTKLSLWEKEYCVWNYPNDIKVFIFRMKTCHGRTVCSNQMFVINHVSIIKPEPPNGLTVERTSRPNAVKLIWSRTNIECAGELLTSYNGKFQYKVEYELPGIWPVEVNSSLVSLSFAACVIELNLPCPGQFYTFRVHQKLKEAVGEEYWSEPSSVSFYSDLADDGTDVDSTCNLEPKETKEVVLHSIYKLNNEVHLKLRKFNRKLGLLNKKRAKISAYLKQQRRTDEL